MKQMPLNRWALPSFGFSVADSSFSVFWAFFFTLLFHTSGHKESGLVVAWIFVSLSTDHIYPCGGFSFNSVNFVNPVHESDKILFSSAFHLSTVRFSCITSRFVWVVELDVQCGDDKMKSPCVDEKSFQVLASSFGCVGWGSSDSILNFSTEIFTPYSLLPPSRGLSEFVDHLQLGLWILLPVVWLILILQWFFEDKFLMRPGVLKFADVRNKNLFSKIPSRSMHTQETLLVSLSSHIEFWTDHVLMSDETQPLLKMELLVH